MSEKTPTPVQRYLRSIYYRGEFFAYLQLDMHSRFVSSGGKLAHFGLVKIDPMTPVDQQHPALTGLLPIANKPVVIANTQVDDSGFTDLHIYIDHGNQWVLFLDTTDAGIQLQNDQQSRLSRDIAKERNSNH